MADNFDGMDPGFVNALQGLMGACGLSLTSGFRTYDEQAALYAEKPHLAAPPGRSNHEDGMAADISGNLDCAHQRAAEFGLHFPMDYEPWHIEPLDMDRSNAVDPPPPGAPPVEEDRLDQAMRFMFGQSAALYKVGSDAAVANTQARVAAGQDPQDAKEAAKADMLAGSTGPVATPQTGAVTSGSSLSTQQIAEAYASAGFSGEQLVTMVAISLGESGGDPQARNLNGSEDSRGLSQINTYAHPQYDPDRLYDPAYNAQAAFEVSGGGTNFGPWTVYSKGLYEQYMDEARAAVAAIGGGTTTPDPVAAATAPQGPDDGKSRDFLDVGVGAKKLTDFGGGA